MRSNLITVVTAVASIVLTAGVATADQVQEQLLLMEQRMAEMEERLQATSDELHDARTTVAAQQDRMTEAGLLEDEGGIMSGVGAFFSMVDISGVIAASYNHRLLSKGDNNTSNTGLFRHPNSNTFAFDQGFIAINKVPTTEDRGGMNIEFGSGVSADEQISGVNDHEVGIFTANVSYLVGLGDGLTVTAGKQGTLMGAEVLQTNQNMNITQGLVWQMQPVTYTGVLFDQQLGGGLSVAAGVFNDIYDQTSVDGDNGKAYFGSVALEGDSFGVRVSNIIGRNGDGQDTRFGGGCDDNQDHCKTNVFNTVVTAQPADNFALWADFTWVKNFGRQNESDGDAYGVALAGELGLTDCLSLAKRFEYVRMESGYNGGFTSRNAETTEMISLTGTLSADLTDNVALRTELRWDHALNFPTGVFARGGGGFGNSPDRDDQLVWLAEMYFAF